MAALPLLVTKHHGAQHHFFGQLLGFDSTISTAAGARHHQSICESCAGLTGVQHVFAVDVTHAGGTDGAVERNARMARAALVAIIAAMSASTSGFSEIGGRPRALR